MFVHHENLVNARRYPTEGISYQIRCVQITFEIDQTEEGEKQQEVLAWGIDRFLQCGFRINCLSGGLVGPGNWLRPVRQNTTNGEQIEL